MQKSNLAAVTFVAILGLCFVWFPSAKAQAAPQTAPYDLLLKGGHVIDPANRLDQGMDVAVTKGKIAAVEKDFFCCLLGNG